jgi:signal transduction histidine kinase
VIAFIVFHMRNQNKLLQQRELQQQTEIEHQKSLLSAVIQSQEGERKRIGQDLHDDVGSGLSNLRLTIDMFDYHNVTPENFRKFSLSYKQSIDHIITDVRHISHNLSPPRLTLFGLTAALEDLTDIIPRSGIKLALNNNAADVLAKLDITVATTLYRVFEARCGKPDYYYDRAAG